MKTKTKTFELQSEMGELVDWFIQQIETEEHEMPYGGSEPSLDVTTVTLKKYTITIKSSDGGN